MKDGYGSKKFWFAIGVVVVGFAYAILGATKLPELKSMFETFSGILEFVTAAYLTGNVANKWVAAKAPISQPKKTKVALAEVEIDPLDRETPGGGV